MSLLAAVLDIDVSPLLHTLSTTPPPTPPQVRPSLTTSWYAADRWFTGCELCIGQWTSGSKRYNSCESLQPTLPFLLLPCCTGLTLWPGEVWQQGCLWCWLMCSPHCRMKRQLTIVWLVFYLWPGELWTLMAYFGLVSSQCEHIENTLSAQQLALEVLANLCYTEGKWSQNCQLWSHRSHALWRGIHLMKYGLCHSSIIW